MRRKPLAVMIVAGATLLVSGCAGVPAAVSFINLYANTLLMARTNKGVTDHVVSALADQDCGLLNIVNDGQYCVDAPAPDVVAMMTADPEHLTPPVQVAAATSPKIVSDITPHPAPVTDTKTPPGAANGTAIPPSPPPQATAAVTVARTSGPAVVIGSYRQQANALARVRQLQHAGAPVTPQVIPAAAAGVPLYRVVVPVATPEEARRVLASARSGDAPDAWLLPQAKAKPDVKRTTRIANPGDTPSLPVAPRPGPIMTIVAEADGPPTL